MPDDGISGRESIRKVHVVHSHGRGNQQNGEQENVYFAQWRFKLPLMYDESIAVLAQEVRRPPRRDPNGTYFNEHPGSWECEIRDGSNVLRTYSWVVGADGRIQPHPEQAAGLTLAPNTFLIKTVVPAGGTPLDVRLHRDSVVNRAWYGLGWRSPQGKAMANAVPNHGKAAPTQP